jgi:hypothetical protein
MRRVVVWSEENFTCLYVSYLYTTLLALLGNNTSQNGASCGQAFSNGNSMPIKHCVTSDLLSQQAFALLLRRRLHVSLFASLQRGEVW